MRLEKITFENVWDIINLKVTKEQEDKDFVASNSCSIIEAFVTREAGCVALPFGIYEEEQLIGFIMFGYGNTGDEDEPAISSDNYCIWRFMIDERYQKKGYGRRALEEALHYLRTWPCGKATYCWLSYEAENIVAKALYEKIGFVENGEMCGDEIVAILHL